MVSTFESLPNEVQEIVFKNLELRTPTIKNCMHVCKSWNRLFQKLMYTEVCLEESQMRRFIKTIRKRRHLKILVKDLGFSFTESYYNIGHDFIQIFALLPNVERISFHCESYFKYLAKALISNQLPHLEYIQPLDYRLYFHPSRVNQKEIQEYTKCAFLLKDRLKELAIRDPYKGDDDMDDDESIDEISDHASENSDYDDELRGDSDDDSEDEDALRDTREDSTASGPCPLFKKLRQFKNLRELHIEKNCNDKQRLIEKVTRDCPSLQRLSLDITHGYSSHTAITNPILTNITPASKHQLFKVFWRCIQ